MQYNDSYNAKQTKGFFPMNKRPSDSLGKQSTDLAGTYYSYGYFVILKLGVVDRVDLVVLLICKSQREGRTVEHSDIGNRNPTANGSIGNNSCQNQSYHATDGICKDHIKISL